MSARAQILGRYELVVGMEVHAQLATQSKLFCGCAVGFGGPPNTRTCPVCLGHPGTLPVLNAEAFAMVHRIALAFGADVRDATEFDRKNYFYPDLPKGYQISQLHHNVGGGDGREGGRLQLLRSGKFVRMHNVHLEEDAGKLLHLGDGGSVVDLNRAGTPLAEIVTYPDLRSVEEVDDFMDTLTEVLLALEVCRCRMQEGNLRFEASVSVRPRGAEFLGPRTEIKNLNSYAAVRRAVAYEFARQVALLEAGASPRQETRLWDPEEAVPYEQGVPPARRADPALLASLLPEVEGGWRGRTQFMRAKEDAHDYRYFPEPDLPPYAVAPEQLDAWRTSLPELPGARRARYAEELGLPQKAAEALTRERGLAAVFEQLLALEVPAAAAANYVLNPLQAALKERGLSPAESPVSPERLAELHSLIEEDNGLSRDLVFKQVWPRVLDEGLSPREAVAKYGIEGASSDAVVAATDAAWAENPRAVRDLLAGKKKAAGAIVGAVMKRLRGQADPRAIHARIAELLAQTRGED
ncbi:MAG: aspartyl/glutamyl-tRNA amidotransferase subunit B [Planctomycetota bacterium]|nr:MAG: aspartyl/glutamyl-tRNA amidotransferase subunit B [Planctomycetota bacterium]